jgi:sialate O-acetylesterase
MRRPTLAALALAALACLAGQPARADVKPHPLFSDGMVLQHQPDALQAVPVWGTAEPGEKVRAELVQGNFTGAGNGVGDKDGKWRLFLPTPRAGGPYTLTLTGKNKVTIKDVYVGEVWVCSGQSNMEQALNNTDKGKEAIANSKNPRIRLFHVPYKISAEPVHEVNAKWKACGPDTVGGFTAVGYYFGRDLEKALNKPVGLIESNWGGTPAQAWTPRAFLEDNAGLKGLVPKAFNTKDPHQGTVLYNGMIAPLQPYAIKGAIWYQGESNAGAAYQYRTLFPAMIRGWRTTWKQGDFPFLFVQLAPFEANWDKSGVTWAELREAQLLTSQQVKNTGMAVITDVGDLKDIHPRKKEPVGGRLALAARALAYGETLTYSGPLYNGLRVEGNKVVLSFKHVGKGLEARGGELKGFTIAGPDKKFHPAHAEIKRNTVVVWSDAVDRPAGVRYGWANFPEVNLFNKDGLPATPFRTDDFPMVTAPKPRQ